MSFQWRVAAAVAALFFVAVTQPGCTSHADRVRQARELFYAGHVAEASANFEQQLPKRKSERDVIALDLAMVQLFSGAPEAAEQRLRAVRDRFEYLEQKDLTESARAMLTDDRAQGYAGEDYEKVLVRTLLALASLMGDGQDALAYTLQVNAKQEEIIEAGVGHAKDNPKLAYQRLAIGAYLHGILREATHANYDDAQRSYDRVVAWEPSFRPGLADLERARGGQHSAPGNGVLYVFTFVGRGPYKVETVETPTSQAVLIADRILSVMGDYSLPPTIAPIKVPIIAVAHHGVTTIQVNVDGRICGNTETITNVSRLAVQQHSTLFPYIVGRAVARRAVKKAAVYAAKSQLQADALTSLALDAAGVAWEAVEVADTRCWGLLPDKIQVLRVELPTGTHRIELQPILEYPGPRSARSVDVTLENGRDTFVLANFPGAAMAGEILTSSRPR